MKNDRKLAVRATLVGVTVLACLLAFLFWVSPGLNIDWVDRMLLAPKMLGDKPLACRPPNDRERQRDVLSLKILRTFQSGDGWSPMKDAVIRQFANDTFGRRIDDRVCPDVSLYADIAEAASQAGIFDGKFLSPDTLDLAHRLGPLKPEILDAVARTAFYPEQLASSFVSDLRANARVVLADFCIANPGLAADASHTMSTTTQLGRAAARVAIACGHLDALPVVSKWMRELLDQAGTDVIDRNTKNVLYELAYAIEAVGPKAQPYSGPISDLLDRKVQSWAPPFGMITYSPVRLCDVAEHIGGAIAEKAASKSFCRPPRTLDQ